MEKHKTATMAETVCKALGLDPMGEVKASRIYFKETMPPSRAESSPKKSAAFSPPMPANCPRWMMPSAIFC